jgi:penicillin amidase
MKVRHVLMGSMHAKLWRARVARAFGPDAMVAMGSANGREDLLIVPVGATEVWRAGDLPAGLLDDALADGSNNWVVHGSRTASGLPLLAGDPHRTLEAPNVYYQNHVACDAFDAIGLSMPGVPGIVHFGHNGTVAWGITHAMADTQDLYVERFRDGSCETPDGWVVAPRREEIVDVRGEAPVRIDVTTTAHGPVVAGDPATGTAIAMRWTGTDRPNASLRAVLPMLVSRSVDELEDAMRDWVDPCNNLLMADAHGTIGYLHRGRVPARGASNGWVPVPGWTGDNEWDGDVAFEDLPRLRDPDAGFISTANNRVCGVGYPHYLGMDYSPPNRARRVYERLAALDVATAADMESIHADRVSIPARAVVEAAARMRARGGPAEEARRLLVGWDRSMEPGSAAAAVYASLRDELAGVLIERAPFAALAHNPFPDEPYATPARTRLRSGVPRLVADTTVVTDEVLGEALERAVARLGDEPWSWGRLHRTQTRHPLSSAFPDAGLDPPVYSMGGDGDCVNAGSAEAGLGIVHSSVARYVFDVADWDGSRWVVPLGSSGDPASRHYADQARAWSEVTSFPMTYSWPRIESTAESRHAVEST